MRMALIKKGEGLTELQKWRVTIVRGYKSRAVSRHEYISATVVNSKGDISYVKIERQRGDPIELELSESVSTDKPFSAPKLELSESVSTDKPSSASKLFSASKPFSASNPSLTSISPTSLKSDSLKSDSLATCDSISPISPPGKKHESDDMIYELDFEGKPFYLYQLGLLAVLVHDENTRYLQDIRKFFQCQIIILYNLCIWCIGIYAIVPLSTRPLQLSPRTVS